MNQFFDGFSKQLTKAVTRRDALRSLGEIGLDM